jgi:glycosyltransferase involved in cell wall biosynthesis
MFSIPVQRMSHIQEWKRAVRCIDSWVAVSGWVKDVLIINGLPLENIVSSRQGLCFSSRHGAEGKESNQERMAKRFSTVVSHSAKGPFNLNNSLHLGYLGRIHPYKGIHVMIQAMQLLKDCENIKLDIAGCDDSKENKYQKDLMNTTRNATRIRWHSKLMPDQIGDFMKTIDVLVIPSVWLETGPMTILEAWAQGVPVLGSNLGGIAEWVEEYGGGWLFKSGNAVELKQSILRLVNNPNMISSIQIPEHVRTIEDVAHEMQEVYDELISRKKRVVALC